MDLTIPPSRIRNILHRECLNAKAYSIKMLIKNTEISEECATTILSKLEGKNNLCEDIKETKETKETSETNENDITKVATVMSKDINNIVDDIMNYVGKRDDNKDENANTDVCVDGNEDIENETKSCTDDSKACNSDMKLENSKGDIISQLTKSITCLYVRISEHTERKIAIFCERILRDIIINSTKKCIDIGIKTLNPTNYRCGKYYPLIRHVRKLLKEDGLKKSKYNFCGYISNYSKKLDLYRKNNMNVSKEMKVFCSNVIIAVINKLSDMFLLENTKTMSNQITIKLILQMTAMFDVNDNRLEKLLKN